MVIVFVETNFLVDVLRPLPSHHALALLDRHGRGEVQLWLPWCCAAESARTLPRVIDGDLGFADSMIRFAAAEYQRAPRSFDKSAIDALRDRARAAQRTALETLSDRIRALVDRLNVIGPSPEVVNKTLRLFPVKQLNPFDEMVAGAVLAKASELRGSGGQPIYFCELDKDLSGTHPTLSKAYGEHGLTVLSSFRVP